MFKKTFSTIKYIVLLIPFISISHAATTKSCGQLANPLDPDCTNNVTIGSLLSGFIPLIPVGVGILLFVMLAVGALQISTSGPNDEAKKKGFQTIQNAITGVVILFFSVGIITLIEAIFGVKILYGVTIGR